jgi:DNA polymerase-1
MAVAEMASPEVYEETMEAAKWKLNTPDSSSPDLTHQLLCDVARCFYRQMWLYHLRIADPTTGQACTLVRQQRTDLFLLPTTSLLGMLLKLPEAPWQSYGPQKKRLNANGLWEMLGFYGLDVVQKKIGRNSPRGLLYRPFHEKYGRYARVGDPTIDSVLAELTKELGSFPDDPPDEGGSPQSSEPKPKDPSPNAENSSNISENEKNEKSAVTAVTFVASPSKSSNKKVTPLSKKSEISESGVTLEIPYTEQVTTKVAAVTPLFAKIEFEGVYVPPSTPQAVFCTATDPDRLLLLDIETFYPWGSKYPQPPESTPGSHLRKQNKGEAHPWAKDPRRCVLRFLTIHNTDGTLGSNPLTIDFQTDPNLSDSVREALATCTLVGHNLDFDLTVLRRYGITVSSSVIDTMIASRLLGLGKEKFKVSDVAYCDLSDEELDELASLENDPNPVDHNLAAVVRRYLGVKMEKAVTKLGGSDWSRSDLSPAHYTYMAEDVAHLPALWSVLEKELREAQLDQVFRERMEFFSHLNQIKMTGNPIDVAQRDADYKTVTAEKEAIREELRTMFVDYRHPIPKSRLKTIKVQVEGGKFKRVPGPTEEEFSPSNRDHVLGALAHRGIPLENIQEITLSRIDQPETRLLLKYGEAKRRLDAIKAIVRSTFPNGRVRPAGWNQLAARTGRIISTEPNLQQVPKNWRSAFRVDPSKLWLKADLSQIEVVILAVVTGDRALIDLFRTGKDLYVIVAAKLFNVAPHRGEVEGLVTDLLRDAAKIVVLGTNYGLTIYGLRRQMRDQLNLELSLEEAQAFFDGFFEMFPGIATYHEKALEDAKSTETVRTAGGQRRFLPPLLDDATDNYWPSLDRRRKVVINTPIQGGQADLQIRAVNKFMSKLPPGVEVVNLVHDEVDAIVTTETLYPAIEVIRSAFREAFRELYGDVLVPNIKFSKGPSWGELEEIAL